MNGKCGHITRMEETFRNIKQPDIITYTTMAKAYIVNVRILDDPSHGRVFDLSLGFSSSSIGSLRSFERK